MERAAGLAGKPGRILQVLAKLALKFRQTDWAKYNASALREQVYTLGRMVRAYAQGHYHIPWRTLLTVLAGLLYFLNPLDLVPDVLPILGLTDDLAVLAWVYGATAEEIKKFMIWERNLREMQVISHW